MSCSTTRWCILGRSSSPRARRKSPWASAPAAIRPRRSSSTSGLWMPRYHKIVVRLKGGDPTLFGRAQEEIDALRAAGIDFEIVPGVTAATAASAELGVSLTRRGFARHVVFVTPRAANGERENDWVASVLAADMAVIYMGAGLADAISAELINRGKPKDTPLALVESATLPERRVLYGTLADLPELARKTGAGPAVVLLGEVLKAAFAKPAATEEIETLLKRA